MHASNGIEVNTWMGEIGWGWGIMVCKHYTRIQPCQTQPQATTLKRSNNGCELVSSAMLIQRNKHIQHPKHQPSPSNVMIAFEKRDCWFATGVILTLNLIVSTHISYHHHPALFLPPAKFKSWQPHPQLCMWLCWNCDVYVVCMHARLAPAAIHASSCNVVVSLLLSLYYVVVVIMLHVEWTPSLFWFFFVVGCFSIMHKIETNRIRSSSQHHLLNCTILY